MREKLLLVALLVAVSAFAMLSTPHRANATVYSYYLLGPLDEHNGTPI